MNEEPEVKTEPVVYKLAQHSVVGAKLADKSEELDMPSVIEAGPVFVKLADDQTDPLMNVDVYRNDNKTEQAQCIVKEFHYDNCMFYLFKHTKFSYCNVIFRKFDCSLNTSNLILFKSRCCFFL